MSYLSQLKQEIKWIIIFLVIIWSVFVIDQVLPLENFGLRPKNLYGLLGVATMTFLHGNLSHIVSNTIPLITLLLLLVSSRAKSIPVVISIIVSGGLLLWLIGKPNSIHIGASLLVFGLAGYLLASGLFFERKLITTVISVFVLFSYGGVLVSGFSPWQQGVSWDGHLSGFLAGTAVAFFQSRYKRPYK